MKKQALRRQRKRYAKLVEGVEKKTPKEFTAKPIPFELFQERERKFGAWPWAQATISNYFCDAHSIEEASPKSV